MTNDLKVTLRFFSRKSETNLYNVYVTSCTRTNTSHILNSLSVLVSFPHFLMMWDRPSCSRHWKPHTTMRFPPWLPTRISGLHHDHVSFPSLHFTCPYKCLHNYVKYYVNVLNVLKIFIFYQITSVKKKWIWFSTQCPSLLLHCQQWFSITDTTQISDLHSNMLKSC